MAISNLMTSAESFPEGIVVSDFSGCFWQPVKGKDKSSVVIKIFIIGLFCCFLIQRIYKLKKTKTVKITFKLFIEYDQYCKMMLKIF